VRIAQKSADSDVSDLAEFRIDYLPEAADPAQAPAIAELCKRVREALHDKPSLVTSRTKAKGGERALLTMSMGDAGVVSRISGLLTGSALSYGSMGTSSAPGQLDIEDPHKVLQIIHASAQH